MGPFPDERHARPPAVRPPSLLPYLLLAVTTTALLFPEWRSWFGGQPQVESRPVQPRGALADWEQTTIEVFRATSPSVVYINTRQRVSNRWTRRVYEVEAGTGSGFVWDALGHVVTNYHVIEGASSAEVVFEDQTSLQATLVGASPDHDLAVLRVRVPPEDLRPIPVGTSGDLVVGQAVFAIGNPFGLHQTLSTGVVSARSRQIRSPSGEAIEDVIQIDAAINPGNSGGPLLDSAGRLIGVNTAIYSPSGASAGVGFAVPVDAVNRVVPQLISRGRYVPPRIGIRSSDDLNDQVRRRLGVEGVVVLAVEPGSSAERAGLRAASVARDGSLVLGDVILAVDGEAVSDLDGLLGVLGERAIGDTATLTLRRGEDSLTLDVVLQ